MFTAFIFNFKLFNLWCSSFRNSRLLNNLIFRDVLTWKPLLSEVVFKTSRTVSKDSSMQSISTLPFPRIRCRYTSFHSSIKIPNNNFTDFKAEMRSQMQTLWKKLPITSLPMTTKIISFVSVWFFYDDRSMLCLFINRNLFPRLVYSCRRWEGKYCDIVSCDGLIGNTSKRTKLRFEA